MPRAFSDTERDLLRVRLIETGKKLLNKWGTKGLTIDDAARESGISKGSFYAFFPSKEDYILSIFESWEDLHRRRLLDRVLEQSEKPREALEGLFLGAFAILDAEPGLARLGYGEIADIAERLPPERLAAHKATDGRVAETAMEAWVKAGMVRAEDIPALGGILESLFVLAIHREDFTEGNYGPATRLIAEALALRLAGDGKEKKHD